MDSPLSATVVEQISKVKDSTGQALAYVYGRETLAD
jgi:hypothetical protein